MHLSKGDYTQFSLKGRLNLLNEFGVLLSQKKVEETDIQIYYIYDFYVQVILREKFIIKVEPLIEDSIRRHYR
jgi:hypothetical protein